MFIQFFRVNECLFLCYSVSEGERPSPEDTARPLKFESRFESGNLRKAIQVNSAVCSRI